MFKLAMTYGVYFHIPFCRNKCLYCGFYSVPVAPSGGDVPLGAYVARLKMEMTERLHPFKGAQADTVYFGGGTPSLLSPDLVKEAMSHLHQLLAVTADAEISLEMNPEDVIPARIAGYAGAGVNRLILGFQTSHRGFHEAIGRSTLLPDKEVLEAFFGAGKMIRGIDIMVGLPGQGPEEVIVELEGLLEYGPEHLSVYCLALEEKTELGRRFRPGPEFNERQRACMEAAIDFLVFRGYRHYEISNFALPGHESRHNMKYWKNRPYLGFGPHAHSFYGNERYMVDMSVDQYLASTETLLARDRRDMKAAAVEYLFTGLRMMEGVSLSTLKADTGFVLTETMERMVRSLCRRDLLTVTKDSDDTILSLTREGIFLSDRVIYELVEDLL